MANTAMTLSGISNARTRTFVILFGAVIVVGVGIAFLRSKHETQDVLSKQGSQTIAVPNEIKSTPGGAVSEQYGELLAAENERRAQEALKKKTSAIPTIIGAIQDSSGQKAKANLPDENGNKNQNAANQTKSQFGQADEIGFLTQGTFTKSPQEREREQQEAKLKEQRERLEKMRVEKEQAKQREVEQERQQRIAAQEQKNYQESVIKIEAQMKQYAQDAYAGWSKFPIQQYVQGELASKDFKSATQQVVTKDGAVVTSSTKAGTQTTSKTQKETKPKIYIKAGTILFGVLDTAVNSDEPGPVMATIVSGKYQGAKVIGSLIHDTYQETVTITFNVLSLPKGQRSIGVQAVAIDPDTARTALASDVNHHYLLRYGTLFASSFISGYGKAVQQSGSTTTTSPLTGTTTTSSATLDNKQIFQSALGEVGTQLGAQTKKFFDTPYTVTVNQGTGIGLLFLSDVELSDQVSK